MKTSYYITLLVLYFTYFLCFTRSKLWSILLGYITYVVQAYSVLPSAPLPSSRRTTESRAVRRAVYRAVRRVVHRVLHRVVSKAVGRAVGRAVVEQFIE